MKLSFVFLCLSLATLSLASIPSAEEEQSLSPSKQGEKNGSAFSATGKSSQATKKKFVESGKPVPKKHQKNRVAVTKGVKTSVGAGEKSLAVSSSGKSDQESSAAQGDFSKFVQSCPKALELIGEYLEGFCVVFERRWSATGSWNRVAVDSERHYLITDQDIEASSHSNGKPVNIGSSDLSYYRDFQSSHDGRSLFLTGMTQEQIASGSSSERTARWLVQDTGTKGFKSATLESDETFNVYGCFMLSANGKTLLSTSWEASTTSVYQSKEHGEAALASKKADIPGEARAVSRNSNRILMENAKKEQFEIHDVSGDGSHLVLKIDYAGATRVGPYALNNDGSKAAFIFDNRKLYTVDVDKQKGSISVGQLTAIDILRPVRSHSLVYDAKDRLYTFGRGSLWLVDSSKRKFISLEKAEMPQGYEIMGSAISLNRDYIALLIRSKSKTEEEEHQYQMIVKRNDRIVLMRLCGY